MRTKSEFRAIRERVGITQAEMARMMGVSQRSVRYWEDANSMRNPPEEAWAILDDALREQQREIAFAMQKVDEIIETAGGDPEVVTLPYWLSESEYLQWSTDAQLGTIGDWRMANANNLALSIRLEERGMTVRWVSGNPAMPERRGVRNA